MSSYDRAMLRIAILSLLADQDYTGYELSKAFDRSVTYIWPASQSQIYPELHRLEAKGLVEGVAVAQAGRPDKRVYRITQAGRDDLVAWVDEIPPAFAVRDPFQLRVINLGRLDRQRAAEIVAAQRELVDRRLAVLTSMCDLLDAADPPATAPPWDERAGWRLSVQAGLLTTRAYRDWCDWTLTQLSPGSVGPERARRT
jgi:DNA-binding PadR family transcriptional regulator